MMTVIGHAIERLAAFLRQAGLWWGLGLSLVLGVGSLVLAGAVVVSWPPDHFKDGHRGLFVPDGHPLVRGLAIVGKNAAGVVLVLLGLVMALPGIPGQGILTMIVGLTLIDFPGKRGMERRLIGRPRILHAINRLRARFHREPLDLT